MQRRWLGSISCALRRQSRIDLQAVQPKAVDCESLHFDSVMPFDSTSPAAASQRLLPVTTGSLKCGVCDIAALQVPKESGTGWQRSGHSRPSDLGREFELPERPLSRSAKWSSRPSAVGQPAELLITKPTAPDSSFELSARLIGWPQVHEAFAAVGDRPGRPAQARPDHSSCRDILPIGWACHEPICRSGGFHT